MTYIVAVEFTSENAAKACLADHTGLPHLRPVGMWRVPNKTNVCTCVRGRRSAWKLGKRFGWVVCSECGRCAPGYRRSTLGKRLFSALGRNLMSDPPFKQPEGWDI